VDGGVSLGDASAAELAADIRNLDISITTNGQVHLLFKFDLHQYMTPVSDGLLPVHGEFGNVVLSSEVSHALGYASVVLVEGAYPVDFSTHTNGEVTIAAILNNAAVPTVSEWGLIILALSLIAVGAIYIHRRRSAQAAPV
jgi:hypothetical protein